MPGSKVITVFLTATLFTVIILGAFSFSLSKYNYSSEYKKLGINETTANNVVNFVTGKSTLSDDFNSRETSHLVSVKRLFTNVKRLYFLSLLMLALLVVYLLKKGRLKQRIHSSLLWSAIFSLSLLLLIFLASANFDVFFNNVHKPFFDADTWLFPADSLLIQTFPQQFFQDFSVFLFGVVFINSAIFLAIGLFIRKKFKQQNQIHTK